MLRALVFVSVLTLSAATAALSSCAVFLVAASSVEQHAARVTMPEPAARVPARGTFSRVSGPSAAPYRWTASSDQWRARAAWGAAAEVQRREVEDAEVLRAFADEVGVAPRAAEMNLGHQVERAERLEDACRVSGCAPGWMRQP